MRIVGPRQEINETIMGWLKRVLSGDEKEVSETRESEQEEREGRWTIEEFAFETGQTPAAHVVELLAARDGEMRQQEIITETGWSRSSVSRLLCGMEAEEEVVRVRLGTENVVYLPGSIPELVRDFESVPVAHA